MVRSGQIVILLLVASLAACRDDEVGSRSDAIIDWDYEDLDPPYDFPAVVRVGGSCTGTLITANHVLTAAHCVDENTAQGVTFAARDADSSSLTRVGVARCFMNPGFTQRWERFLRPEYPSLDAAGDRCGVLSGTGSTSSRGDSAEDFAILQLERPVPHPLANPERASAGAVFAVAHIVATDPPAVGEEFGAIAVGFGQDQNGISGRRRVKRVTLTMGRGIIAGAPTDGGDSGGPLFRVREDASLDLVGVASTQDTYAAPTTSMLEWIRSRLDIDADGRFDTYCPYPGASGGTDPLADTGSDADGDGYLDSEDTCPATYNPCQLLSDLDGDGTLDDCDGCPTRADIDEERGTLADADRDRLPDLCDCNEFFSHGDADLDFVPDACDNCRSDPNPFQENRDGDPLGDACDGCPNIHDFGTDLEPDGVPEACDNCTRVFNPLQTNCNLDAELALWEVECPPDPGTGEASCPRLDFTLGDACDDTPCGETRVGTDTVGARSAAELVQAAVRVDARAQTRRDGRTGFRFCRCRFATRDSLEARLICADPDTFTLPDGTLISLGDCGPADLDDYDTAVEPRNWRWTTMAFADDPSRPAGGRSAGAPRTERDLAYEPVIDGGERFTTDLWAAWDLRDRDVPRWRIAFEEPIPDGLLANLTGLLWTHTPGPPGGGDASDWDRELASHFWSGRTRMSSEPPIPAREPFPCIAPITPRIGGGAFGGLPIPWIGWAGGACPSLLDPRIAIRLGPHVFERQPGFDPAWLSHFEAPETRWVAAAEPGGWLPEQGVRYVGLDAGGLALRSLLVERDGGLVDAIKQQPCAPNQCEAVASHSRAAASSAASSRLLVLSARRRMLWAIDVAAVADRRTRVRVLDLPSRRWHALEPDGAALGHILAATYAPLENSLWVLDEVPRGRGHSRGQGSTPRGRAEARLLRLDVSGPNVRATVVGRWPRVTANDRFAIATDPAGALYLAGSQAGGRRSVILRLERGQDGEFDATGFIMRPRSFVAEGLRANEYGLTLVLDDPTEGALPEPIDFDELRPGRGGIVRCL